MYFGVGNIPTQTTAHHPLVHTLNRRIVRGFCSVSGRHFSVMQNQKAGPKMQWFGINRSSCPSNNSFTMCLAGALAICRAAELPLYRTGSWWLCVPRKTASCIMTAFFLSANLMLSDNELLASTKVTGNWKHILGVLLRRNDVFSCSDIKVSQHIKITDSTGFYQLIVASLIPGDFKHTCLFYEQWIKGVSTAQQTLNYTLIPGISGSWHG